MEEGVIERLRAIEHNLTPLVILAAAVGLLGAAAGAAAVAGAYLPWYVVTARVGMLGTAQETVVASLAGWQAHPWGWLVAALGAVALVAGLLLALDRPLPWRVLLLSGCALGALVAVGGLRFPPVARFDVADSRLRELVELSGRLPADVQMAFEVHPSTGMWLTLAAAAAAVVAAVVSGERV